MEDSELDFAWQSDPEERARLERNGQMAAILGIVALSLGMMMACSYYTTLIPAIAFGGVAAWLAMGVIREEYQGVGRAYANVGLWTGLIAAIFCSIVLLLCGTFMVLYVGMIGGMLALGV